MKIVDLLKKEDILQFQSVESKSWLIDHLINKLITSYNKEDFDDDLKHSFFDLVFKREAQSSTGIGSEIAFPHGRINGLKRPLIALAIVNEGVEFTAPDKKKVKLVLLFLFPGNRHDLGVKIQAVFARFLGEQKSFDRILQSDDVEAVYKYIENADLIVDTPIIAQDLMRNVKIRLLKNMQLQEATSLMNKFNTEVAPVVDVDGNLLGEINCVDLFQMELPDYIKQLHSAPRIHDFNPFEKYFAEDADLIVEKVYTKEVALVEYDASLFEIIFLLAVKKHYIVHVCQNGKLIGVIDKITVLDKVFNF